SNVDPAVRRVGAPCKCRIDTCQRECETGQAADAQQGHCERHPSSQPEPERKTAGDLEERGDNKNRDAAHDSKSADKNSRVPAGPVSSTDSGPPSGSTVI